MYLGSFIIDDTCTFYANAHTPATGAAVDADAVPGYRVYEDETGTPILTGSMALLDDTNTVGFYSEQITLSAANGFEAGKSYCVRITIVVGGVTGVALHRLQIGARVDTRLVLGSAPNALQSGRVDAYVGAMADGVIAAAKYAADMNVYQAKVTMVDDDTGTADRYIVTWFKNGIPIFSGITSPTIQVIKSSDGTDLVAVTAMTEIGSTGLYKKDEATNRMVDGASYVIKTAATIDSATRSWAQPFGMPA